ncbi:hypothetical protein GCM10009687_03720 [Asanoa iriomotensis]|uniref:Putative pterin-4-alpha-carbinolamine dehydratase n=1 Tax=Asanoa iriomotensis TaxID=234613 RepID=A0ABQ4C300_9ACTN|nr:hypothetical protein Air01nite_32290 [Asanoa iriomotensis]
MRWWRITTARELLVTGIAPMRVGGMVWCVAEVLGADELQTALAGLDGWAGDPSGISRTAELASFPGAIAVVDRVAEVAEELDHHPDIDIRWRRLLFTLSTHSAGGVTRKDLDLASRIDTIIREAA